MATVSQDFSGYQSDRDRFTGLVPPELVDPFADDDRLGMLALELGMLADECPDCGLPLAAWLDVQATLFECRGGSGAQWLGRRIRELAEMAVRLDAATPADFDARLDVIEAERDEQTYNRGRADGYDAASREHAGPSFAWLNHFN